MKNKRSSSKAIAAVIPAYNAQSSIEEVVKRTKKYAEQVIVVDDGSSDNTSLLAEKAGARVLKLEKNKGKANAIKQGIKEVEKLKERVDYVVFIDADLQHLPEEIPLLVEKLEEGYDLCIGSRFLSNACESMPIANKFSNAFARKLIKILTKQNITDPQSGFRAAKFEKIKELELKAERYAIEHIMILEAVKKGLKIGEAKISCVYAGEKSHIRKFKDTLIVAYNIARFLIYDSLFR